MLGIKFFLRSKETTVNDVDDTELNEVRQNETMDESDSNRKAIIIKKVSTLNQAFLDIRNLDNDHLTIHYSTNELLVKLDRKNVRQLKQIIRPQQVIAIQSGLGGKFCIFWRKSAEEIYCLNILRNNNLKQEDLIILCSFLLKFISSCLLQNHSSLSDIPADDFNIELSSMTDTNGLNLLFHAASHGNTEMIPILLQVAFNVNMVHEGLLPIDFAYTYSHYETVLLLLNNNSLYPHNISLDNCPNNDLVTFNATTEDLYWLIRDCNSSSMDEKGNSKDVDGKNAQNLPEISKILSKNSHLRYFHNLRNLSALGTALYGKKYEVYELLLKNNLFFTLGESIDIITRNFKVEEKEIVREIHFRNKKDIHEPHLLQLLKKSSVGHNDEKVQGRLNHVLRAFQVINEFPMIKIILKIAAMLPNLQIVFDFNEDSVEYLDPTQNGSTTGLFYFNGRVYVGALQLLNPLKEHEVFATIAHELCHFVLYSIFSNKAKPYKEGDENTETEFERISLECELKKEIDKIISVVYDYYPEEMFHTELIVRIPHFYAHYHNQPDKIETLKVQFQSLFEFYESNLVPKLEESLNELKIKAEKRIEETKIMKKKFQEMKKEVKELNEKIPKLETAINEMNEKIPEMKTTIEILETKSEEKKKKISRMRISTLVGLIILLTVSGLGMWWFFTPTYKWSELDEEQKIKVFNGKVRLEGIDAKFNEIYGQNETTIRVFEKLTSDQIKITLKDDILDLNDDQNKFLQEEIILIYQNLTESLKEKVQNSSINFQGQSVVIKTLLKNITEKILTTLNSSEIFDLIKDKKSIKIGKEIENSTEFHIKRKFVDKRNKDQPAISSSALIYKSESKKIILLSDDAGNGKTTTFKHLALEWKQKYPQRWIQYVDLKLKIKIFERHQNNNSNLKAILAEIVDLIDLNVEIFEMLYDDQNVVILWDGFDEISPTYSDFMLGLIENIKNQTQNIQFISTRPHYEKSIENHLNCSVYKLKSLTKIENEDFLNDFYSKSKLSATQIQKAEEKVQILIQKVQEHTYNYAPRDYVESPLMLKMISEVSLNDDQTFDFTNLYTIYDSFINTKIKLLEDQGDVAKYEEIKIKRKGLHLDEIFQYYAVKSFNYDYKWEIVDKYKNRSLDVDLLSRYGILIFDSNDNHQFVHRTFQEFFLTQYLVENFYDVNDKSDCDEINKRFKVIIDYTIYKENFKVEEFLSGYFATFKSLKNDQNLIFCFKNHSELNSLFFKIFYMDEKISYDPNFDRVTKLLEIFPFTSESLEILWHLDRNKTFFSDIASKESEIFLANFDKIQKNLTKYLGNDQEKQNKLLFGRNQRGSYLYAIYYNIKDEEFNVDKYLQILNVSYDFNLNDLKSLNIFEFNEFYEYVKSKVTAEETREMSKSNFIRFLAAGGLELWNEIESKFTREELQELIYESKLWFKPLLYHVHDYILLKLIFETLDEKPDSRFFKLIQDKDWKVIDRLLLRQELIMLEDNFEMFWNATKIRTTKDERKKILELQLLYISTPIGLNIFSASIEFGTVEKFEFVKNIYEQHFDSTEKMREFCEKYFEIRRGSYDRFNPSVNTTKVFVEYLKSLFTIDEIEHKFKWTLTESYELNKKIGNLDDSYPLYILLKQFETFEELNSNITEDSGNYVSKHNILKHFALPANIDVNNLGRFLPFSDFHELVKSHLNNFEVREFLKSNFIKTLEYGGVEMWKEIETKFTREELQELIYDSKLDDKSLLMYVDDFQTIKFILQTLDGTPDSRLLKFIHESKNYLFLGKDFLMFDDNFEFFWSLIKNRTTRDERLDILELKLLDSDPGNFNIFDTSIEKGTVNQFEFAKNIYEENFNSTEDMRTFCEAYFEITRWPNYRWHPNVETAEAFVKYLKKLFTYDEIQIKFKESLEQLYEFFSESENLDDSYPLFSLLKEL